MLNNIVKNTLKLYAYIECKREHFKKWLISYIPTYLYTVVYINNTVNSFDVIYNHNINHDWNDLNDYEFNEGYYMFTFWNSNTHKLDKIVLHSNHIKKALKINHIDILWAFNEYSMINIFIDYITKNNGIGILDIDLDDIDVYNEIKCFIKSVELPNNFTPKLLKLIIDANSNEDIFIINDTDINVCYLDFTGDSICKKNDEYLVE